MKRFSLVLALLLLSFLLKAQNGTFTRSLDFHAKMVTPNPTGGYFLVGADYFNEAMLMSTTALGDPLWSKKLSLPGGYPVEIAAANIGNRGFIIAASDQAHFLATSNRISLMQVDTSGGVQWAKDLMISGASQMRIADVIHLSDEGFLICGSAMDTVSNSDFTFITRLDSLANVTWTSTFEAFDHAYLLEDNGDFFIAGTETFEDAAAFLVKLNGSGSLVWGATVNYLDQSFHVASRPARIGNSYFIPFNHVEVFGSYVEDDIGMIKIDAAAGSNYSLVRYSEPYTGKIMAMREVPGNGLVLTGYTNRVELGYIQSPFLVKVDTALGVVWSRITHPYGGVANDVTADPGGGYVAAGKSFAKTDSAGFTCMDTAVSYLAAPSVIPFYPYSGPIGAASASVTSITITVTSINQQGTLSCIATGVAEDPQPFDDITIFPNPSSGQFNVKSEVAGAMKISVTDLLGKQVHAEVLGTGSFYTVSGLKSGVYFVKMTDANNKQYIEKVIVQ